MKWKRRVWNFMILWILSLDTILSRERRNPGREGLRLRKLILQKEQARFLRRLLYESSQLTQRSKGKAKHRWANNDDEWNDHDDHRDFDQFKPTRWQPNYSKFSHKQNGRKKLENVIDTFEDKSCCPQRSEIIEPNYGRNRSGHVVELYKDEKTKQRFYEIICEEGIENEPCRFLQGKNRKLSKCSQQYLYTYALVQSQQSGWSLDHIRVKSGCICKLHNSTAISKTKKISRWEIK